MVDKMLGVVLATLWDGKATIKEFGEWTDWLTKTAQKIETVLIEDEPCRISHASASSAVPSDTVTTVEQQVTLFIRPDLIIKPGSRITVTQNGRTVDYKASGQPRVYSSHQEIALQLWDNKT